MTIKQGLLILTFSLIVLTMFGGAKATTIDLQNYEYQGNLTVDSSMVFYNQTGMAILITEDNIDNDIFIRMYTDWDIVFFNNTDLTVLPYEIVNISNTTNTTEMWVGIPVNTSTNNTIGFAVGNATATDYQDPCTLWGNLGYFFVYHFEGNSADSSCEADDGTEHSVTYTNTTLGQGIVLDGSSGYVDGTWTGAPTGTNPRSLEMYANFTGSASGGIAGYGTGSSGEAFDYYMSSSNIYGDTWTTSQNIKLSFTQNHMYYMTHLYNGSIRYTGLGDTGTYTTPAYLSDTTSSTTGQDFDIGREIDNNQNTPEVITELRGRNISSNILYDKTNYYTIYYPSTFLYSTSLIKIVSNMTITAVELTNNVTINSFNVTINGTDYSTTTGSITTNLTTNGSYYTLTFTNTNFETETIYVIDSDLEQGLNQKNITISCSSSFNNYTTNLLTMSCNVTNPTNLNYNLTYWYNNSVEYWTNSQYENNTIYINLTNFQDEMNFWTEWNTTYKTKNNTAYKIPNDTINTILTFNIRGGSGGTSLLTNVEYNFINLSYMSTSNPLTLSATNFLNRTNHNHEEYINITDNSLYHVSPQQNITQINETNQIYNFTLEPNKLTLSFSSSVDGLITDTICDATLQSCKTFSDSSVIIVQQNLSEGIVKVLFNNGTNYTWYQEYTYYNDFTTHVNETVSINSLSDVYAYIKVVDVSNIPIEQAKIRVYQVTPNTTGSDTWTLSTQKLSNSDGYTTSPVYMDSSKQAQIIITADGYQTVATQITPSDQEYLSKSTALIIVMEANNQNSGLWDTVLLPRYYYNSTNRENIQGLVFAPNSESVKVITAYTESIGGGNTTLSNCVADICLINLTSGTDFASSGTDNITIKIYIDGELIQTRTVQYYGIIYNIFDEVSDFNGQQAWNIVVFLGLMVTVVLVQQIWANTNAGTSAFMIGGIAISALSTSFAYLSVICMLHYGMKSLNKIIGN